MDIAKQVSVEHVLESFEHMPMSVACSRFIFSFLSILNAYVKSGFNNLHPYQSESESSF